MPANKKNAQKKEGEPVFILKPALKNYGLDYLHIELIALVVVLAVLAFALASFKPGVLVSGCAYGEVNGTCTVPAHNSAQALAAAERVLASYATINTSFSLLPYYALVNESKVSYLINQSAWFVSVPYVNPFARNSVYNFSLVLYDSNLSLKNAYAQTIKPVFYTNDSVIAPGAISVYSGSPCTTTKPVPVYTFIDPYSKGALSALSAMFNASKRYASVANMSYYFIFTGSAASFYDGYGVAGTQMYGRYLSCASRQPQFGAFLANMSIAYTGVPPFNTTLYGVAQGSGLNISAFNACMANSTASLNAQSRLADLYSVATTPEVLVNCKYATIPQTIGAALNYSLSQTKG
jgi:hypothetical protein